MKNLQDGLDFPLKTKQIRENYIGGKKYFVFDLDQNIIGKRKRLYARSKEELLIKIEEETAQKRVQLIHQIPTDNQLSHYIDFYFKNAIGNLPIKQVKSEMAVMDNIVKGSSIDKDIETITTKDLQTFYNFKANIFSVDNLKQVNEILSKVFTVARNIDKNIQADTKAVVFMEQADIGQNTLTIKELEQLKNICEQPIANRYGESRNILLFSIFMRAKISSVLKIRKDDIDFTNGTVLIDNKPQPMPSECKEWIRLNAEEGLAYEGNANWINNSVPQISISSYRHPEYDLLFGTEQSDGEIIPVRLTTVTNSLRAILKRAGLPMGITATGLEKSYFICDYMMADKKMDFLIEYSERTGLSTNTLTDRLMAYATKMEVLKQMEVQSKE